MEPTEPTIRLRLILGKYRVVEVEKSIFGFTILMQFTETVKVTFDVPQTADVREGDLLTLYTEVLTHAQPSGS